MPRFPFPILLSILAAVPIAALGMPGLAQVPDTQVPDTQVPDTQVPDTQVPDTQVPGTSAVPPADYQVVTGNHWSFSVPSDWQDALANAPSKPENVTVDAQWSAPQRQAVMNLVTERYDGSSDDYIQLTLNNLTSLGLTVNSQQAITVGTLPGLDLEVTVPFANPPVQMFQRVIADEGTGYVMTCGGSAADFETTRSVCANIFNSFQITP